MKKMKGTCYAHIGTSYTPALDAEIDRVEAIVLNHQARINELSLRVQHLLGLNPDDLDLEQAICETKS